MTKTETRKCVLCGAELKGIEGNNPDPLASPESECCSVCDRDKVLPARMELDRLHDDPDKRFEYYMAIYHDAEQVKEIMDLEDEQEDLNESDPEAYEEDYGKEEKK